MCAHLKLLPVGHWKIHPRIFVDELSYPTRNIALDSWRKRLIHGSYFPDRGIPSSMIRRAIGSKRETQWKSTLAGTCLRQAATNIHNLHSGLSWICRRRPKLISGHAECVESFRNTYNVSLWTEVRELLQIIWMIGIHVPSITCNELHNALFQTLAALRVQRSCKHTLRICGTSVSNSIQSCCEAIHCVQFCQVMYCLKYLL